MGRISMKPIVFIMITMLSITFFPKTIASSYQVTTDLHETHFVNEYDHNLYKLHGVGKTVNLSIKVQSGGNVDFYLFTDGQYNIYVNPETPYLFFEEKIQHSQIYSFSGSDVTYNVVVDNDEVTQNGAMPTNNVTYTVNITYQDLPAKPKTMDPVVIGGFICGTLLVLAVGTTSWFYTVPKKYKENAKIMKRMSK